MRDHKIFSSVGVSSVLYIVDTCQVQLYLLKHSSSNWRRHFAGAKLSYNHTVKNISDQSMYSACVYLGFSETVRGRILLKKG